MRESDLCSAVSPYTCNTVTGQRCQLVLSVPIRTTRRWFRTFLTSCPSLWTTTIVTRSLTTLRTSRRVTRRRTRRGSTATWRSSGAPTAAWETAPSVAPRPSPQPAITAQDTYARWAGPTHLLLVCTGQAPVVPINLWALDSGAWEMFWLKTLHGVDVLSTGSVPKSSGSFFLIVIRFLFVFYCFSVWMWIIWCIEEACWIWTCFGFVYF